jgi:hypothetical protein
MSNMQEFEKKLSINNIKIIELTGEVLILFTIIDVGLLV